MLKYGCQCLNCGNREVSGTCSKKDTNCDITYREGGCPVSGCRDFVLKKPFVQEACQFYAAIEQGGITLLKAEKFC